MIRVEITVKNRPGVFDPESKVLCTGIERLGHKIESIEVSKRFILAFDSSDPETAESEAKAICNEFLVNTVLQDFELQIIED